MMSEKGTLYLFTGLAGTGKTTIGGLFYDRLRLRDPEAVLLDGDRMRSAAAAAAGDNVMDDSKYTTQARMEGAWSLFPRCKELTDQGKNVVCCTISLYNEPKAWGKANIEQFREIYVKASWETLRARNPKGLYSPGRRNVVGVDLPYDEPVSPDVVIQNDGQETPEEIVSWLERLFGLS